MTQLHNILTHTQIHTCTHTNSHTQVHHTPGLAGLEDSEQFYFPMACHYEDLLFLTAKNSTIHSSWWFFALIRESDLRVKRVGRRCPLIGCVGGHSQESHRQALLPANSHHHNTAHRSTTALSRTEMGLWGSAVLKRFLGAFYGRSGAEVLGSTWWNSGTSPAQNWSC